MANILFVDDSATMQKVAQIAFLGTEHEVQIARGLDEAQKKQRENQYHAILVDAGLLSLSSAESILHLQKGSLLENPTILILKSRFSPYQIEKENQLERVFFFDKPFEVQTLLQKVREILTPSMGKPSLANKIPGFEESKSVESEKSLPTFSNQKMPLPSALSAEKVPLFPVVEKLPLAKEQEGIFPSFPRAPLLKRAPVPELVAATLERLAKRGEEYELLAKFSKEEIHKVIQEVVPPLVENMIREEVRKFLEQKQERGEL